MKNTINYREILILLAFMAAIVLFPTVIQYVNGLIYSLWDVQPGPIVSNLIYLLPNIAILLISIWFLHLDGWKAADIGANARKIFPGLLFAILALVGLYVILPIGTALFFEPRSLYVSSQPFTMDYTISLLSTWVVAGICIAVMTWGYLLNKTYSILMVRIPAFWKQVIAIVFSSLFFTLLHIIRFQMAHTTDIGFGTVLFVFFYCVFCSYLYVRTKNIYVAAFRQAAYAFPPLSLTGGGELVVRSFGFLFPVFLLFGFIVVLAETYDYWGSLLEFKKEEPIEPESA